MASMRSPSRGCNSNLPGDAQTGCAWSGVIVSLSTTASNLIPNGPATNYVRVCTANIEDRTYRCGQVPVAYLAGAGSVREPLRSGENLPPRQCVRSPLPASQSHLTSPEYRNVATRPESTWLRVVRRVVARWMVNARSRL